MDSNPTTEAEITSFWCRRFFGSYKNEPESFVMVLVPVPVGKLEGQFNLLELKQPSSPRQHRLRIGLRGASTSSRLLPSACIWKTNIQHRYYWNTAGSESCSVITLGRIKKKKKKKDISLSSFKHRNVPFWQSWVRKLLQTGLKMQLGKVNSLHYSIVASVLVTIATGSDWTRFQSLNNYSVVRSGLVSWHFKVWPLLLLLRLLTQ